MNCSEQRLETRAIDDILVSNDEDDMDEGIPTENEYPDEVCVEKIVSEIVLEGMFTVFLFHCPSLSFSDFSF